MRLTLVSAHLLVTLVRLTLVSAINTSLQRSVDRITSGWYAGFSFLGGVFLTLSLLQLETAQHICAHVGGTRVESQDAEKLTFFGGNINREWGAALQFTVKPR